MRSETERPFDLETGPLYRVVLYRVSENRHLFHFVVHHLVSDGWSDGIFLRDLAIAYRAASAGQPIGQPELPIQYSDYASWERRDESTLSDGDRLYWRNVLKDPPMDLLLPSDRRSSKDGEYRGRKIVTSLAPALVAKLKRVAQQADATLFMTLLAGFKILLHRYTGEHDIIVGTPVANRSRPETRELIGLFLNTVAIRTSWSEDLTCIDFLAHVREQALAAFSHQELPFGEVLKTSGLGSRLPFNAMLQLRNAPQPSATFGAVQGRVFDLDEKDPNHSPSRLGSVSRVELAVDCVEQGKGVVCSFEFNSSVLTQETVADIASHFESILMGVADDPTACLVDLDLAIDQGVQQTIDDWGDTSDPILLTHELFEAQAETRPGAIAVVDGDSSITYDELNKRANGVAVRLGSANISTGHIVGLCVSRSIDMVVGVLGILKSGAAYLPMDPEYPARRLEFILTDAAPDALVTVSGTGLDWIADINPSRVRINLDEGDGQEHELSHIDPVDRSDLAYVMYTSGSTGQPKGVMVEHGSLSRLIAWAVDAYELDLSDRVLQFASLSFDASVEEIFPTLAVGATLVLRQDEMMASAAQFFEECASYDVSVLNLPTAHWHKLTLALSDNVRLPNNVRAVVIGGEPVSPDVLELWNSRVCGHVRLVNTYGPTEGTVVTTACDISGPRAVAMLGGVVPIGKPIANLRTYILDPRGRFVPYGVVGELYVAGSGVARGYLGNPDLTLTTFLPDAFNKTNGAVMYRTGDMVRRRSDGHIEFHGRADRQVKLRGHRIELGEIEHVLQRHPGVRVAVVALNADDAGEQYLVAHVIGAPGFHLTIRGLRDFLYARLPEYMVPQHFTSVLDLPLDGNGKVDLAALPDPRTSPLPSGPTHVELGTPTQLVVAKVWGELLGTDRIGAQDDLFDLGANSLVAMRILARLRQSFHVELSLRAVFVYRTVETISAHVDELAMVTANGDGKNTSVLRPVTPAFHNGNPPLSFAQQRVWYLDQLQPNKPAYNIAFALELKGPIVVPVLEQALAEVVRRHEVLRSKFVMVGDTPAQLVDPTIRGSIPVTDLVDSEHPYQGARSCLTRDANMSFDLATGPVFRARLIRIADQVHVFGFVVHHIAADGWSVDVLLREIGVLYQSFVNGRRSPLGRPVLQYSDFAAWQKEVLSSKRYEQQLDYWRQKLGGDLPSADLPADRARPHVQGHHGDTVTFDCSEELTNNLENAGRNRNATLFMVLLAAFKVLLQRYTNENDLRVGTSVTNRVQPELENLIGFFSNTLVLRSDLTGAVRFADVLERVRSVCLEAYENQDPPFEYLVEELQPTRDVSRTPFCQTMFAYQETTDRPVHIGNLAVERFEFAANISRCDLYVWLQKTRDGLRGVIEYNTDVFDSKAMGRFSEHYNSILRSVALDFDLKLAQMAFVSSDEHAYLVGGVNDTSSPLPSLCVHQMFEQQVSNHADKIAVQCGDQSLTYEDLDARANAVARYLQARGVTCEYLVGITVRQSVDMLVAVLGVLKSGAAYVPLDPEYPETRLNFMIRDSGVAYILTELSNADRLARVLDTEALSTDVECVCLDADWPIIEQYANRILEDHSNATNLAYVMYTSGSNGVPKGVEVQHDSVVNVLEFMKGEPGIDAQDVWFAATTLSCDMSVVELLLPLAVGARVVIGTHEAVRDGTALMDAMCQANPTVMQATPAIWRVLVAAGWQPTSPIKVLSGGEALLPNVAADLLQRAESVWNLYGPTETSLWSTCQRITDATAITIGHPITNTRVYILDDLLQPVPLGVTGELYIAGVGVTRGYRGRPELTAENFVSDPFVQSGDNRMYRTGDLARRRQDGSIDLRGRTDHQVKVRGHRVELGEIESALVREAGVAQCVVSLREIRSGDTRVVAYVVPVNGKESTGTELRTHLRTLLPGFMIPQHFVTLQKLPVGENGKCDRSRLPPPFELPIDHVIFEEPASETEKAIADIWRNVLGLTRISRFANFFDLGGHSLLSMSVVSRIARELNRQLSPRAVVTNTLAQIAAECDRQDNMIVAHDTRDTGRFPSVTRTLKHMLKGE